MKDLKPILTEYKTFFESLFPEYRAQADILNDEYVVVQLQRRDNAGRKLAVRLPLDIPEAQLCDEVLQLQLRTHLNDLPGDDFD